MLYVFGGYNDQGFVNGIMNKYEIGIEDKPQKMEESPERPKLKISRFER